MSAIPKTEWIGVCCQTPRDHAAINSWFGGFLPEAWGSPLKADILTEVATDREKAIRALYRLADGRLKEARVNLNARGRTYKLTPATPGILTGPAAEAALGREQSQ